MRRPRSIQPLTLARRSLFPSCRAVCRARPHQIACHLRRFFTSATGTFASSFAGFLQQQGLPSVGRVAFTRVWHDEPALGDILPSGRFYAAITAAGAGEPLTRGGVAGVVIGCIVIGAMVVGLVYATVRTHPVLWAVSSSASDLSLMRRRDPLNL